MCHKINPKETLALFQVTLDELHDLKEIIFREHAVILKKYNLGNNPDLAWCGEVAQKRLCFKSKKNMGKEKCTETLINGYYN